MLLKKRCIAYVKENFHEYIEGNQSIKDNEAGSHCQLKRLHPTVGYSKALANPQYGSGGFDQYGISDYQNVLDQKLTLLMSNR